MTIEALYSIYLNYPSIQTDTRKLKPGDVFFALKGPNFNANAFAQEALNKGAAYAIIDDEAFAISKQTILVSDVLETLQTLAKHHRQQFSIPFLAITGSNGKTTTKELIHAVLSRKYKTYTTEGNLNNHIGVPLTILKIRKDAAMAVIEMGANHLHEIESYCRIALPTHGLITNCGKAHLEGFGGVEGVRKGKGELYDHLRATGGTAFAMWDYDYLRDMSKGITSVVTYGTKDAAITGTALPSDSFLAVQFNKGLEGTVKTQLVGDYNLPNVLAASAVGTYFSVSSAEIKTALSSYSPSNSRSQFLEKGSNKVILDAYNANPSSMKAAIENFANMPYARKVLVLGAMAELGADSLQEHQQIVDEIAKKDWDSVLLVGGDFRAIRHPYLSFPNADEAGAWLKNNPISHAYLLIKGSRSMQMEKTLTYL